MLLLMMMMMMIIIISTIGVIIGFYRRKNTIFIKVKTGMISWSILLDASESYNKRLMLG